MKNIYIYLILTLMFWLTNFCKPIAIYANNAIEVCIVQLYDYHDWITLHALLNKNPEFV